jgi:hypothetical protein
VRSIAGISFMEAQFDSAQDQLRAIAHSKPSLQPLDIQSNCLNRQIQVSRDFFCGLATTNMGEDSLEIAR